MLDKKISARFIEIRKELGFTDQKDFAEKIGMKWRTVQTYEQGTIKKVPLIYVEMLKKHFNVSSDWLLHGEGEKYITDQSSKNLNNTSDEVKFIFAPIMSVKASAGKKGSEHYEVVTTGELLIDRMLFKVIPNLKNIRAIEVDGDSMYPTLKEGDYVIIEENREFSGDGIYVLQWDGILLVKRLQAGTGEIDIISDNQSYPPKKYIPSDDQRSFHIVGKVILRMQR